MPRFDGFIGGTAEAFSLNQSAQRTVNLYPEVDDSGGGKVRVTLIGTPGLRAFATLPNAPIRGIWVNEYRLFGVGGSRLYEVFEGGFYTYLGDVGDDGGHTPVQLFPNGNQLLIISAGKVYVHTGTEMVAPDIGKLEGVVSTDGTKVTWESGDKFDTTMATQPIKIDGVTYIVASVLASAEELTLTTTAGVQSSVAYEATPQLTARCGAFLDGYFVVARPDSKQINLSALYDGKTWDMGDFAIKEGYPDNIVALLADHEELWIFGSETTEVWRNTGNADFPFERDMAAFIHQGIVSTWVPARLANGVAWLGGDTRGRLVAWRAQGFVPVRISTHAVENAWSGYETVSDAISYTFRLNGHEFWRVIFPSENKSWQYDANTGFWCEIASGATRTALNRHRGRCHGFVFGKHLIGDYETGAIREMAMDAYDDAGTAIWRGRRAAHITMEEATAFHHRFQLDVQSGLGAASPQFLLEWSDNGGHSWTAGLTAIANEPTDTPDDPYGRRVEWRRLGSPRNELHGRSYGVWSNAAIPHCWMAAHIGVTKGVS